MIVLLMVLMTMVVLMAIRDHLIRGLCHRHRGAEAGIGETVDSIPWHRRARHVPANPERKDGRRNEVRKLEVKREGDEGFVGRCVKWCAIVGLESGLGGMRGFVDRVCYPRNQFL